MDFFTLFGANDQTLIDDESGQIRYTPRFIDVERAAQWMEALLHEIPWREGRRQMYDREVDVPRLRANFQADDPQMPAALRDALELVRSHLGIPFDSLGLNLYRDHRDSVAPHNDKLEHITKGYPIVLLSLGATRTMVIRRKEPPHRRLRLELDAGSLLSMSWETQLHYDHGIPKQAHYSAARISIAFRVRSIPDNRDAGEDGAGM
jgi:alkylated DNA repair dioxygenase AlkB